MRILLVAIFGFILAACGQDYEEVFGIKIGAPISEVKDLNSYRFTKNDHFKGANVYSKNFNDSGLFSDGVNSALFEIQVIEIDSLVQGVEVNSSYVYSSDMQINNRKIEAYIDRVVSEYGEPVRDQSHFDGETRVVELIPQDSVVHRIFIIYSPDSSILVEYRTKEADDVIKRRIKEREK